jgi:uncharacterized protein (TIGR03067 family)
MYRLTMAALILATWLVPASAQPASIDFEDAEGTLKGKVCRGIYALDGGALIIGDNAPSIDKARPAAFAAKRGTGYVLIAFRRAKA